MGVDATPEACRWACTAGASAPLLAVPRGMWVDGDLPLPALAVPVVWAASSLGVPGDKEWAGVREGSESREGRLDVRGRPLGVVDRDRRVVLGDAAATAEDRRALEGVVERPNAWAAGVGVWPRRFKGRPDSRR